MYLLRLLSLNLILIITPAAMATINIFTKSGNIYYVSDGKTTQITNSGKDHDAALSPNKMLIAFARAQGPLIPKECLSSGDYPNVDELWLYNLKTKNEKILVSEKPSCDKPEKTITSMSDLKFSPDNKLIYFVTDAWATSGALHVVDINGYHEHYITPALGFDIVPKGSYKGYLLVGQHRYFVGGGSYNWTWLISPKGKDEGPLGEDVTKDQMDFLES